MPFSSKDLFGDTSDLDGFSDDEDNGNLGKSKKYRDFTRTGNLFPNKKIRADNWKSKNSNLTASKNSNQNENIVREVYSGIRLSKPLVSSEQLATMMAGRKMIKLSKLKNLVNKSKLSIDGDWVTIGVIVNKTTKTSQKGKEFSIWNLSDLVSEKLASFFLFGSVHEKHWKLSVGSVIGLLNATFLTKDDRLRSNNSDLAPLTIDEPDKLLHIGTSKDLSFCKAIKKSGDICGALIMKAEDEFCLYHIKNAYRKFSSKRADLQANFANKEPEQYHFANSYEPNATLNKNGIVLPMVNLNRSQLNEKKENEERKLNKIIKNPLSRSAQSLSLVSKSLRTMPISKMKAPSSFNNQSFKDGGEIPLAAKDIFDQMKRNQTVSDVDSNDSIPKLAKGHSKGDMIEIKFSKNEFPSKQLEINKQRAIEILRRKRSGSLKDEPNQTSSPSASTNSFAKSKKLALIMKKVNSNLNATLEDDREEQERIQQRKSEETAILEQALKRKSINNNMIDVIENEAQQNHFKTLEKRENYENRLAEIKEINVKVVTCTECRYTSTSQSDFCKSKNHQIRFHEAKRRFFSCKYCHHRITTLDSMFPATDCPKCGKSGFDKASIIKIKTETKLGDELLLRGEEIKFLNTLK
ncbi:Protein MCM10 -like protein [Sarcoptes scabiei]|uniref:Protein MCM10 homolog n=1 Tax=Sarcoptes scabiei TaxID=52283 RepID=A0A834RDF8_SARSC|nr:Protein MCM10 -like protein [Sarcoptes scabiei]